MAVVAALIGIVLVGCGTSPSASTADQPTATTLPATATPASSPVLVYFSKGQESMNDWTVVFPVQRVAPTAEVAAAATYAIEQLIAGPTPAEKDAGYFTELPSVLHLSELSDCNGADFTLRLDRRGATPQPGAATLQFCRPTSSPGIGADARITAEIDNTLTQFSPITKVFILNYHGDCFGDGRGGDACLQ